MTFLIITWIYVLLWGAKAVVFFILEDHLTVVDTPKFYIVSTIVNFIIVGEWLTTLYYYSIQ